MIRLLVAVGLALWTVSSGATHEGLLAGTMPRLLSPEEFNKREVEAYAGAVARRLVQDQHYPSEALRRALQGTVRIDLTIGRDGRVRAVRVTGSSGHPVLDEAAIYRGRTVEGLPPPPPLLRGREFHLALPVTFRLE